MVVPYWKVKEGNNFPSESLIYFQTDEEGASHIYNLPEDEYAGLIKVKGQILMTNNEKLPIFPQICPHYGPYIPDPESRDREEFNDEIANAINEVSKLVVNNYPNIDGSSPAIVEKCLYTVKEHH